jgi:hypothetical protein
VLIIITMFGQVLRLGLIAVVPPNITAGVRSRASPEPYMKTQAESETQGTGPCKLRLTSYFSVVALAVLLDS